MFKNWKKAGAFLLSLALILSMLSGVVFAAEEETFDLEISTKNSPMGAATIETEVAGLGGADSEDLLTDYIDVSLGVSNNPMYSITRTGKRLTGNNAKVYQTLQAFVEKIASGEQTVAKLEIIPSQAGFSNYSWTAKDFGLTTLIENGRISSAAYDALVEALGEMLDFDRVITALLFDTPYDLYWYDKQVGAKMNTSFAYGPSSITVAKLTFSFVVSDEYADPAGEKYQDQDGSQYNLSVAKSKTSSVQTALSRIESIVNAYSSLGDFDKMSAYKNEICKYVSYNRTAAKTTNAQYGNPWQLIWVFDNDSSTNVVCEGYAKAFQYLCDLSDFSGLRTESRLVTGSMDGGTGAGPHMWNVVTMDDGRNYLVDITNCDSGTIGAPDHLFIKEGSKTGKYDYKIYGVGYIYDADTKSAYVSSEITLSTVAYEKVADYSRVEAAKAKVPADLSVYTAESVKRVNDAVAAVIEGKKEHEQAAVNAMAKAIEDAIAALKLKPADYSAVEAAKAKVPSDLSIYTDNTVQDLNDALAAAVPNKKITEQAEVDAMAQAIEAAVAALEIKPADYSAVDAAIAKVPSDLSIYTDDTVEVLNDALDAVVPDKKIMEQAEVDAMAQTIEDAVAALELKPADYTEVEFAQAKIAEYLDQFTDETVHAVNEAIGKIVEGKKITEQAEVDAYAKAIEDAIDALEPKPGLADYRDVAEAQAGTPKDLSIYTEETAKEVSEAVLSVVKWMPKEQQDVVDSWAEDIKTSVAALELKPADYTEVDAAIAAVPVDLSNFTDESILALQDAIDAVVRDKKIIEQTEVDEMAQAINDAVAALELKPADYTAVDLALEKVPAHLSDYTDETVKAVEDAINAVDWDKKITEQAEVDAMAQAIEDAVSALEAKTNPFRFVDVSDPNTQWFYDVVYKAYNYKNASGTRLMSGYAPDRFPDGIHFGPADPLSRGQFAVMLYRYENEPKTVFDSKAFPDVQQGVFFDLAATWASKNMIITGYNDGRFGPADNITREQLATILYRYAKFKGYDTAASGQLNQFTDSSKISPFAVDAVKWAVCAGVISGKESANGTRYIDPYGSASRAECAAMFIRFIDYVKKLK